MTKVCSRCEEDKSFSDYYKTSSGVNAVASICKECVKHSARERYKKDPLKHNASSKSWYEKNELICINCNNALGLVDDNQEILQDLIRYLNMYDGSSHGGFVASIYASDQSN